MTVATLTPEVQASLNLCPLKIIKCEDRRHALQMMRDYKDEWVCSSVPLKQVNCIVRESEAEPETDAEYHTDNKNHRYCAKFRLCEGQYIYFHFVVPYEIWNHRRLEQKRLADKYVKDHPNNIYSRMH